MNTLRVLFWSLVWMFLIALPGSDSGITFSLNPEKLPTLGGCQRTTATCGPIRGEYCGQLTRSPPITAHLAALHVDAELVGRVGRGVDGALPGEPVGEGAVGVVQPEGVLGARQPAGEVDRVLVTDVPRTESCVGGGRALRWPENYYFNRWR